MLTLPDPPLADEAVRLREPAPRDLDGGGRVQDPLVQRFTRVPTPYKKEADGRAFIGARGGAADPGGVASSGWSGHRGDDRLLGMIGLIADRHDALRAEIGYWVSPDARGRGVATRALRLLSRWCVTDRGSTTGPSGGDRKPRVT